VVGVLEKTDEVGLRGLLEGHDGVRLEAEVLLEVLGNFAYEALEGHLADKQFSTFLVPPDLAECDGSGPVAVGLLHTTGSRGGLAGGLGGERLAGGLATSGLASSLLGTCHLFELCGLLQSTEDLWSYTTVAPPRSMVLYYRCAPKIYGLILLLRP
jgi:hypothetical protein